MKMNKLIDIEKFLLDCECDTVSILRKRLNRAEVKPKSCVDCTYDYQEFASATCITCTDNPATGSNFKQKECEHTWFFSQTGGAKVRRKCENCGLIQWAEFDGPN